MGVRDAPYDFNDANPAKFDVNVWYNRGRHCFSMEKFSQEKIEQ